ncbi:chaperonin [Culex quinquefasciatus]|uniref:Chaperonin n=1 Tax=Culex quinquefasciatus TaxID=7176 RepID=B0WH66_CULQU|nr:chaperonin [Culex quinquefasciatus]|eukprot:XP_001848080.1 chaperonin [Culex quinquefasciatus]
MSDGLDAQIKAQGSKFWDFLNQQNGKMQERSVETFAEKEKGEFARLFSFVGAIAIGDLVKSTLGPKGMDKSLPRRRAGRRCRDAVEVILEIGLDGEDCRAGGRREGEDEGKGDNPDQFRLGRCDLIEQVMIGEDTLLRFSGVPLIETCTVVICGAAQLIIDKADRSLHDTLRVVASETSGKESMTIRFGLALF